ncbi:hypothetical protein LH464_11495 [Neorhizobium sp. T786]|uniref:hypothetical protein n=1 Tax=Pseudorhizobium xiangyangii TaxID=2883104 RepID=UPI001CFFAE44|nr:hypothetical protein [Neorhizobium xiangyangii]MCB5203095.1 hypothetical protein [Neorhizobium xiangyangii]
MPDMSRLAAMLMFLSWLLYGAMPAMASVPVTTSMQHTAHAASLEVQPSAHQDHAHAKAVQAADESPPCPHGGKSCITPLCAACLTIVPYAAEGCGGALHLSGPVPDLTRALVASEPGPLERPPRR